MSLAKCKVKKQKKKSKKIQRKVNDWSKCIFQGNIKQNKLNLIFDKPMKYYRIVVLADQCKYKEQQQGNVLSDVHTIIWYKKCDVISNDTKITTVCQYEKCNEIILLKDCNQFDVTAIVSCFFSQSFGWLIFCGKNKC